jgi:putative phage-type endonuclease
MDNPAQGSADWHAWRAQGIGGSEVGTILGLNPYQTPFQLWRIRTKRDPADITNFAIERGQRLEPKARAFAEISLGLDFPPALAVWSENPIFRVSLDGYNLEKRAILEIKCPGITNHELNLQGEIQPYYRAQMEYQLLCTDAELVYFVSYYEPGDGAASSVKIIEYRSDPDLREMILKQVPIFWDYIVTDTPPPLTDRDVLVIDRDPLFEDLVKVYRDYKSTEQAFEILKKEIASKLTHPKVRCGPVLFTKIRNSYRCDIKEDNK